MSREAAPREGRTATSPQQGSERGEKTEIRQGPLHHSASAVVALKVQHDTYHYVIRQAMFAVVGIAALAVAMHVDYRAYRNEKFIYGVLGVVGVMLVAVLFTKPVNGAQ